MRLGSLFTGYGGLDIAACEHFDAETVWTSDVDPGACKIIAHRYPDVPNLGDITTIDWSTVEPVDILTGGFPCQDVSHAGKRAGLRPDTRTGLWSQMAYAINQLRPRFVVAENVRGLLSAAAHSDVEPCPWCLGGAEQREPDLRALGAVLGDLADIGYDARWVGLRAADIGAPHGRFRVFVVAEDGNPWAKWRRELNGHRGAVANTHCATGGEWRQPAPGEAEGGRPRSDTGGRDRAPAPADTDQPRRQGPEPAGRRHLPTRGTVANAQGDGRHQGRPEPAGIVGRPDAAVSGDAAADTDSTGQPSVGRFDTQRRDPDRCGGADIAWGDYEPAIRGELEETCGCAAWGQYAQAIHRWEVILGRLAPSPTELSPRGAHRLSPRAVEFMMGLPAGWVTDVPGLSRNAQLKALGNGVVPQQALAALRITDTTEAAA